MSDAATTTTQPLEGFRSVRGQDRAVALLARAVANDRVASAYLFEGPDGVGKERVARALAQVMVCASRLADGDACAMCGPCKRVAANHHVDVITLARTVEVLSQREHKASDVRSELVVEKVRELQSARLAYHSHEGSRWVIVRDAHELNAAASNALLKTLEEPPARTHFALVTSQSSRLLTTIRSRCQRVRFAPLDDAVVAELLVARGVAPGLAKDAARLADGSMSKALELSAEDVLAGRRALVDKVLGALRAARPGAYVESSEALKDLGKKDAAEVDAVLALLERHFRDEAVAAAAGNARAAAVNAGRAELVRQAVDSLDRNLNLQMVLEGLLVRLREVRG